MKTLAVLALSLVMLVATQAAPAAKGKGRGPHGKPTPSLKLVTAGATVADTTVCGNPYDMQPDPGVYTTICIQCPTLPDGPGGATVWVPTLYGVVTDEFDYGVALLAYTYGCDAGSWYYWTRP